MERMEGPSAATLYKVGAMRRDQQQQQQQQQQEEEEEEEEQGDE